MAEATFCITVSPFVYDSTDVKRRRVPDQPGGFQAGPKNNRQIFANPGRGNWRGATGIVPLR